MLTDGRTDDGRTTDARVTGILIAHLGAFGSGELKIDKPLVVLQMFGKHYDGHNSITYIMTKL